MQSLSDVRVGGTEEYSDSVHGVKFVQSASEVSEGDWDMNWVSALQTVIAVHVESEVLVGAVD